jgi:hypothetical protein
LTRISFEHDVRFLCRALSIDSAKVLGLIDVEIYDSEETKNSSNVAQQSLKLIILNLHCDSWTFYQSNAETVAELLNEQNVPVISPLSKDVRNPFNNLYQTIPASEVIKIQCLNTCGRVMVIL